MALTLPQALQRLTHPVMQGIVKTVVTTDQMASILPMVPVHGESYRFAREGTLPTGGVFISDAGTTTEESTGTDDKTTIEFRRVVGNMDIDALANVMSDGQQAGTQLQKKVKATWRNVSDKIVNGSRITSHVISPAAGSPGAAIGASATYSPWTDSDRRGPGSIKYTHAGTLWQYRAPGDPGYGTAVAFTGNGTNTLYSYNKSQWIRVTITVASATADGEVHITFASTTNEFEGLEKIVDPSMIVNATNTDGDDYSYAKLDRLMSLVKIRSRLAFVMPSTLIEKHYAACRALGGTDPAYTEIPSILGTTTRVPSYRGVPLLVNDWIPADETVGATTNATSMYLGSFDDDEGVFLACCSYGGQQIQADADPRTVPVMGFYIKQVGTLEGKDADRTRVGFYGALGIKSPLALAKMAGLKTA
jgi:hypothetical protein